MSHVTLDRTNTRIAAGASSAAASPGPSDFARLYRGRRMPIQFHADLASRIYSGLALGLFAYLAMLPDGQAFSIRQMQRTHKEGRDAWSGALAELFELGLVCRIRWSDGRGQWRTRYYLAEDHPFDADDIAFLRDVHGDDCLVECSPELSNCPIQVSSRVSRRPRKTSSEAPRSGGRPVTARESCPSGKVVDNSATDRRNRVSGLVGPGDAIAATGRPAHAIAATGPTRANAEQVDAGDLAAIAGTHKEGKYLSFPPPYPPHGADVTTSPAQPGEGGTNHTNHQATQDQASQDQAVGASTAGGSGEQLHQHTPQVMAAVLRTWPMLSRTDARHIQALIGQRLAQGHRPDDLRHTLTDNPGGARVPGRLLIHRLQDLADPAPQHPGIKPWCGACDHRFIDHGGYVHHCPTCHPTNTRTTHPASA